MSLLLESLLILLALLPLSANGLHEARPSGLLPMQPANLGVSSGDALHLEIVISRIPTPTVLIHGISHTLELA